MRTLACAGRSALANAKDESRRSLVGCIRGDPLRDVARQAWLYPSTISYEPGSGIAEMRFTTTVGMPHFDWNDRAAFCLSCAVEKENCMASWFKTVAIIASTVPWAGGAASAA